MKKLNLLGFDFGASSGRAILGELEDGRLKLTELHRFSNDPVMLLGTFVWDVQRLFYEMKQALNKAALQGIELDAIGIDTWGVDFGLLDEAGRMVGIPTHYRDARTDGMMEKAYAILPKAEIFGQTGVAFMQFNTLYQLLAMKLNGDPALKVADKLLFTPDLLAYFLTGVAGTEYTIASTSQLTDPATRDWCAPLIEKFGLPKKLFGPIQEPGQARGLLSEQIARELGMKRVPVIAIGSHDTASAVAAVPAREDGFAYISSGTWSLLGAELKAPLKDVSVMEANYSNEGGVDGTTRLLRNIMGLWMIQECKREWDARGEVASFAEIVKLAEAEEPFRSVIDVDDQRFLAPGDMPGRIRDWCREHGEPIPETRGQVARAIYEGLALKYRWAVERLEKDILKSPVNVMHIVGGGGKNAMLNQFTANALKRPVVAGPYEATAVGNLLMQARALGALNSLAEQRAVVAASFENETFMPEGDEAAWDAAYARLINGK